MTNFQNYLRKFCDEAGSVEQGAKNAAHKFQVSPRSVLSWMYGANKRPRDILLIIERAEGQLSLSDFFEEKTKNVDNI